MWPAQAYANVAANHYYEHFINQHECCGLWFWALPFQAVKSKDTDQHICYEYQQQAAYMRLPSNPSSNLHRDYIQHLEFCRGGSVTSRGYLTQKASLTLDLLPVVQKSNNGRGGWGLGEGGVPEPLETPPPPSTPIWSKMCNSYSLIIFIAFKRTWR